MLKKDNKNYQDKVDIANRKVEETTAIMRANIDKLAEEDGNMDQMEELLQKSKNLRDEAKET